MAILEVVRGAKKERGGEEEEEKNEKKKEERRHWGIITVVAVIAKWNNSNCVRRTPVVGEALYFFVHASIAGAYEPEKKRDCKSRTKQEHAQTLFTCSRKTRKILNYIRVAACTELGWEPGQKVGEIFAVSCKWGKCWQRNSENWVN